MSFCPFPGVQFKAKAPIVHINAVLYTHKHILRLRAEMPSRKHNIQKISLTYLVSCGIIRIVIDCLCVTVKVRGQAAGLSADVRVALHTLLRLYASTDWGRSKGHAMPIS